MPGTSGALVTGHEWLEILDDLETIQADITQAQRLQRQVDDTIRSSLSALRRIKRWLLARQAVTKSQGESKVYLQEHLDRLMIIYEEIIELQTPSVK